MQWCPRTDRNAEPVQDLGHVVGMDPRQVERHDAAALVGGRPVQLDPGNLALQRLERVPDELALVLADRVHAEAAKVVRRGTQADGRGHVRRARLELPRDVVPLRAAEMDLADHLPARQERRHRLEQLAARPQGARAERGEHLVAGERVEVGADRLDVNRHVRERPAPRR